jgi:histidine kinase
LDSGDGADPERAGEIEAAIEMSLDITDTRLLENKLQLSERKYRAIFDNIPNAVFVLDARTLDILDCNESVASVYGFSRESLMHKSFMSLFMPEERERHAADLRGRTEINRARQRHESGRTLFVNIRAARFEHVGQAELLVTASDITRRLETEQQLIQTSKMATLGEMAAGIAHELNQPLSVIKTASGFFIRKIKKGEPIDPEIQIELSTEIDNHVNRASNIINHMREFGRKSDLRPVPVRIAEVMGRAFELFSQQLKLRGIAVVRTLADDLPLVLGDCARLEQVFINLLINARDAIEERWQSMPDAGASEKRIDLRGDLRDGQVVIEVEDTGSGVPEGLREKIFEPFFTTKEVGKGTGLGLSISYGIVRECNGTIRVRTGEAGGACFSLSFPVYEAESGVDIEYGEFPMTIER